MPSILRIPLRVSISSQKSMSPSYCPLPCPLGFRALHHTDPIHLWQVMADHIEILDPNNAEPLRQMFAQIDTDGSGFISQTQDLRTEHGFSRLHDPPGCRHPPYQGGQGGSCNR
jgi:hypothetical protein